jgi:hypothetical protein
VGVLIKKRHNTGIKEKILEIRNTPGLVVTGTIVCREMSLQKKKGTSRTTLNPRHIKQSTIFK